MGLDSSTGGRATIPRQSPAGSKRNPSRSNVSAINDNRRELMFAAVLVLVGIAALYPALKFGNTVEPARPGTAKSSGVSPALDLKYWVNFTLQDSQRVTHDIRIFRFALDPKVSLGFHAVSYLLARAEIVNNRGRSGTVIRSYVPISDLHARGYFDLMIKIHPEGMMSQRIARLRPGDGLEMRGPVEMRQYKANMRKYLGMIAGGVGIAPMLQLINDIMSNPKDNTQVSLIFENESPEEIPLKDKLDKLAQAYPNFKVFYTVNIADESWKGGLGHVSANMIYKGLPRPSAETLILVSGPEKLMDLICGEIANERFPGEVLGLLRQLGYKNEQVQKF